MHRLIQLLEEKFDLKIKVCGNCKCVGERNFQDNRPSGWSCNGLHPGWTSDKFETCENWTPKEVEGKKEK